MNGKPIAMIVGTGTIGEPLTGLMTRLKEQLGLAEVFFHKRTPRGPDLPKIRELIKRGAKLVVDTGSAQDFCDLGLEPHLTTWDGLDQASVVIDATPKGVGQRNKETIYVPHESSTSGFIAQGSEFGFGKPYARGINDSALIKGDDKYIQVVSCNTHNLSVLVQALALDDGGSENLVEGNFVCMRRSNDISQEGGIVPAPEPGAHKDERFGTHHAHDAWHLFKTLGYDLPLFFFGYQAEYPVHAHYLLRYQSEEFHYGGTCAGADPCQ